MEHESSTGPEQIAAGLEALIGRQEVSEQYVRFRIGLLGAQRTVYHALTAARDRSEVVPIEELPFDETPFDEAMARQFLEDLSGVLNTENGPNRDLTRLSEAAARDRELLARVARRAACGSDIEFFAALAENLAADVEALLFFGRAMAAPFVTEAVRRSKPRVTSPQSSNACPWCSSAPGLAALDRDAGKRILFCSVCGESWEFSRVKCPFCGDQAVGRSCTFSSREVPTQNVFLKLVRDGGRCVRRASEPVEIARSSRESLNHRQRHCISTASESRRTDFKTRS